MNAELLQEKWRQLEKEGGHDPALFRAFRQWFEKAGDWDLYRMNPVGLAAVLDVPETPLIDFFVHGARVGIFDFSWSMVCPSCGEVQNNDSSLNSLEGHFHCTVCQAGVQVNIDDSVEVAFSVNPSVKVLSLDPFENPNSYRKTYFSQAVERSPEMLEYINTIWEGFESVEPGDSLIRDRVCERGKSYRFVSAGIHSQFLFHVAKDAVDEPVNMEIEFGQKGMYPSDITVNSLQTRFIKKNTRDEKVGLMMVQADFPTLHRLMKEFPAKFLPMLTGNKLLNNQRFRELFKIQNLSPGLRLNIRSLTLLFTDLKGSTELYARTGDVAAYQLIQEHFRLLGGIVARHGGALIKTMGDAIMASFNRPLDAVKAAQIMLEENLLLTSGYTKPLGLKIGLHEGPALAISNQGALDYFGQTVNIAARVQGVAGENSLWLTEPVLKASGVASMLKEKSYVGKRYQASLKGIGEKTVVYEIIKRRRI